MAAGQPTRERVGDIKLRAETIVVPGDGADSVLVQKAAERPVRRWRGRRKPLRR